MSNLDLRSPGSTAAREAPSTAPSATEAAAVELPAVKELAYDGRSDRVGVVMELRRTYAVLRPPGGGLEWDVPLACLHRAERGDELRARVAELNVVSRWSR